MSLTPLDVRKQQFKKALSGFDPDEVKAFLGLVAGEMERLLKEHSALNEQVLAQRGRIEEYQTLERSLRDAVVAAQGMRDESRRQAEREAELILAKAELEAEGRLRQSEMRLADLRRELTELKSERQNYLIRLRALIDTHMRMVEASEARYEAMERSPAPAPGAETERSPHPGAGGSFRPVEAPGPRLLVPIRRVPRSSTDPRRARPPRCRSLGDPRPAGGWQSRCGVAGRPGGGQGQRGADPDPGPGPGGSRRQRGHRAWRHRAHQDRSSHRGRPRSCGRSRHGGRDLACAREAENRAYP